MTSWFAVGLLLVGIVWACFATIILLAAAYIVAGPLGVVILIALGVIALGLCVLALASTPAGRAAKQCSLEKHRGF